MPILYACMINLRRTILVEALGTRTQSDFKSQVLKYHQQFDRFGKKYVNLNNELNLSYRDNKEYAMVCIANAEDIKELEA